MIIAALLCVERTVYALKTIVYHHNKAKQ